VRFAPTYRHPTALGNVELSAAYRDESAVYFSETNQDTRAYFGPAWHEVDLRASLHSLSGHWEAALFARNVLDDRHITQIAPYNGFPIATLNTPRVVGIAVTLRH
jgi:hypothetical protein